MTGEQLTHDRDCGVCSSAVSTEDRATISEHVTAFLLARIAEDEAQWSQVRRNWCDECGSDAARVLAECAAKRRIVELAAEASSDRGSCIQNFAVSVAESDAMWAEDPGELILLALASVYADHPDFPYDRGTVA